MSGSRRRRRRKRIIIIEKSLDYLFVVYCNTTFSSHMIGLYHRVAGRILNNEIKWKYKEAVVAYCAVL
jgi:hypothetical protein